MKLFLHFKYLDKKQIKALKCTQHSSCKTEVFPFYDCLSIKYPLSDCVFDQKTTSNRMGKLKNLLCVFLVFNNICDYFEMKCLLLCLHILFTQTRSYMKTVKSFIKSTSTNKHWNLTIILSKMRFLCSFKSWINWKVFGKMR